MRTVNELTDLPPEKWEKKAELSLRNGNVGQVLQYQYNAEQSRDRDEHGDD